MSIDSGGKLTRRVIVAMFAGMCAGIAINLMPDVPFVPRFLVDVVQRFLVDGLFDVVGSIFIKGLRMLVVPLVFVSLVCGTASLKDVSRLGNLGVKTLGLYLASTAVAISIALSLAMLAQPGVGFDLQAHEDDFAAPAAPSFSEVVIELFPDNPIASMAEGNMLQVIVFAILLGLAMSMAGEAGETVASGFAAFNKVLMRLIVMIIQLAPYGVFCLIAKVFAEQGFDAFAPLAAYFLVVACALILHLAVTYSVLLRTLAGLNPLVFFRKVKSLLVFAFSTSSSNATIPVTLETVEERLGVRNSVAAFTVPLGATINMDGTAIMQGVATVFISQAYGIEIGIAGYLTVVLSATLASIGTAGVPGVGLITLAMVLDQVGLPVEGIGLIIGVDRLLDMLRTAVNVSGDAVISCIVARSEGEFDVNVYEKGEL